jgi:hypothetical protein
MSHTHIRARSGSWLAALTSTHASGGTLAPDAAAATTLESLRLASDGRLVRVALTILLVPTLWFTATDFSVSGGDREWLALRLSVRAFFVGSIVFGALMVPRSRTRGEYERTVLLVTMAAAGCLIGLNALRPEGSGLPLRAPLMWLFAFFAAFPNAPRKQFAAPIALTFGTLLMPVFWEGGERWVAVAGNLLVLLTVNAVGLLLVLRRQQLATSEAAAWAREASARASAEQALRELKVLRGIIPICAHCKRVRSAVGDWQQIESYVRAHSSAEFSHGMCPSCLTRHYPEY